MGELVYIDDFFVVGDCCGFVFYDCMEVDYE